MEIQTPEIGLYNEISSWNQESGCRCTLTLTTSWRQHGRGWSTAGDDTAELTDIVSVLRSENDVDRDDDGFISVDMKSDAETIENVKDDDIKVMEHKTDIMLQACEANCENLLGPVPFQKIKKRQETDKCYQELAEDEGTALCRFEFDSTDVLARRAPLDVNTQTVISWTHDKMFSNHRMTSNRKGFSEALKCTEQCVKSFIGQRYTIKFSSTVNDAIHARK